MNSNYYYYYYKTKFKEIKLVLKFILFTAVYPAGKLVSVSFERNCGVASVGEYNKVIRYYQLLIIVDSANWPPSRVSKLTKVDNVNWPPLRVSKLTFRALAPHHSLRRRTNARNVCSETINGGQFYVINSVDNKKWSC